MSTSTDEFDPERVIAVYREVIRDRDCMKTAEIRSDYEAIARRLRAIWNQRQGADTLHEAAFGKLAEVPQHID